jgi:hypothetical protein
MKQPVKMNQYNQSSVALANIVFNQNPRIKVLAIRDDPSHYTIVRRGDTPSNQLFSRSVNYYPSRINIQELMNRISVRMASDVDTVSNRDSLAEFINRTLASHQPRLNPLPQKVMETLDETKIKQDNICLGEKCSICLDQFKIDENVITLKCKHITHSGCLRRWFLEHNTCPQCRFIPGLE